tara:strand:+ start:6495 stop:6722 length:228 start_codon:yes stop_codon:yes gene_type:complete
MQHLIREYQPKGAPIILQGEIMDDDVVAPSSTRMYPIIGGFIGAPIPEHLMHHLGESVATRLTKLYHKSLKDEQD